MFFSHWRRKRRYFRVVALKNNQVNLLFLARLFEISLKADIQLHSL